ncbi:MAG: DUF5009 domain-containing protein [Burkholderiaceae bacterium]|nr:DUF5009 domain-containing protein [Burkholderiaceae bacterium]
MVRAGNTPFGPPVRAGRIVSIDAFRALTVLVMIIVNEWHGVAGLPAWMQHMPADADAMSFVDVVFPAFLFIVGMSVPFALQQRLAQGNGPLQVQLHVLQRALGLVVIGVFMVNAESGFHQASMALPVTVWALLSYVAAFLIWGSVRGGPALVLGWRVAGVVLLLLLAWVYRGGESGETGITPQWWGILGLIGWAYLLACLGFWLVRGRLAGVLVMIALCLGYYLAHHASWVTGSAALSQLFSQEGHASHAAIVLCGCACALIFFDATAQRSESRRFTLALGFALALALLAALLRPEYRISKIYATPSWALYSAASCVLIFVALYAWIECRGRSLFPGLLAPVAANPLVAYLIPFIVGALMAWGHLQLPLLLRSGLAGILYAVVYALGVALLVRWLAGRGLRLRI